VDRGLHEEKIMSSRHHMKLVREGPYVAEVDVELVDSETGWPPYLMLEDAQKLDEVREALRRGDLKRASQLARVFKLAPIAV
jgi:hypothetical protein